MITELSYNMQINEILANYYKFKILIHYSYLSSLKTILKERSSLAHSLQICMRRRVGCACKQVFAQTVATMSTKSGEMEEHYCLALLTSEAERRDQNGVVL